jgi:NAD(P)-dependent dehydrogenase (short-subunit alcohol dehydrogenase family)
MEPTVLITGASSGIGAATADRLVAQGFRVFGTSRHPDAAAQTRPGIHWIAMDVCDEESVRKGVEQVHASGARLDALVCNAGFGIFGSVEEVSIEAAKQQFETNFFGTLRTLRAALPAMREAGHGRIVVVGSLSGRAPIPFQAHYSASKAALDALVMALRSELHGLGVWVSLVEPGDIQTDFNDVMQWGDPGRSVYSERIRRAEGVIRESLPAAPGPERVARTIHRALTARRPRVRYACGPDSWLVPIGRRLLPDWLSLSLIRRHFGS